jgi:3-oxoacyl-[acyl-carrier-protein] synthase II
MAVERRVVITGTGLVSALGNTPEALHMALCNGESGVGPIGLFQSPHDGGEISNFDASEFLGDGNLRPLDRIARLAASAAQLALTSSSWSREMRDVRDVGIVLGTVFSGAHTISVFDQLAITRGPRFVKPLDFANTVINAATGQTAIWHNLRGINSTIATGASSGLHAIGHASDLILSRRSDMMLAGGAEELCYEMLFGFERLGLLSTRRNSAVPFDADRTGLVVGEGAAFMMLEDGEMARQRGATILGEICGYAMSFDPQRGKCAQALTEMMSATIRAALANAQISFSEVDCISSSASGVGVGDRCEAHAISTVFGSEVGAKPITAIKSGLGETLGASGALQSVALLEHMTKGLLPGICGFKTLETGLDLPSVGRDSRSGPMRKGLVLSFGLDGNLCAMVFAQGPS